MHVWCDFGKKNDHLKQTFVETILVVILLYRKIFAFFQETEPNARIRFTVTAGIGFSLIALSTET